MGSSNTHPIDCRLVLLLAITNVITINILFTFVITFVKYISPTHLMFKISFPACESTKDILESILLLLNDPLRRHTCNLLIRWRYEGAVLKHNLHPWIPCRMKVMDPWMELHFHHAKFYPGSGVGKLLHFLLWRWRVRWNSLKWMKIFSIGTGLVKVRDTLYSWIWVGKSERTS